MSTATVGLSPFLDQLDQLDHRLSALGPDEMRQVLLDHAGGLPAAQRAALCLLCHANIDHPGLLSVKSRQYDL
ncbi:MAG: hypothetical protein ACYCV7_12810 [Acidimicrobiales bacterium]